MDPTLKSPTRADYMAHRATHEEYYRAVNATAGVRFEADHWLVERARVSSDPHFNDVPLKLWDRHGDNTYLRVALAKAFRAHGDVLSLAGIVCCLKQAVRDTLDRTLEAD